VARAPRERPQHQQIECSVGKRRRSFAHTLIARVSPTRPGCPGTRNSCARATAMGIPGMSCKHDRSALATNT
jgi:hypothetical protein